MPGLRAETGSEDFMRVLLANPRGFCAGVDRAVKIVDMSLEVFGAPVYVRREIVHNSHVVNDLRDRGAVFVEELEEVPQGAVAILSAHGVAPEVFEQAKARSVKLIDATCPLVTKVHLEVHRFVKEGYHIILIGHEGHDEVIGTLGESPDHITLVENEAQAAQLEIDGFKKLMVLTQTTLGIDDTASIMRVLRDRFPSIDTPPTDDVCYATQNRQDVVKAMADRGMDLLLVVGSQNSSNAARLVEVGQARGARGHLIDGPRDIKDAWFRGVESVGLTAGASTPEHVVQAVVRDLNRRGCDKMEYVTTVEEDVVFQIPPVLKNEMAARSRQEEEFGTTA